MRIDSRELLAVGVLGNKSKIGDRIEILLRRGRTFSSRASGRDLVISTAALAGLMLVGSFVPRWIAFAQQAPRPTFEVASIKPGDPNSRQVSVGIRPGGRFSTTNASLQTLIGFAYDVRNHQISGGPNWLESARFNIDAKPDGAIAIPPGPAGAPRVRLLVQSLLKDRFKLATHKETRDEQVYELVLNKGGSKLREVPDPGLTKPNGLRLGPSELIGTASPMSLLANQLSQRMGRSVIDKTGLRGRYDFTLKWTPDQGASSGGTDATPPADTSGPSIFTAVQEQLGLRLQSARGPVEILVIDHVEKPDAN
ncbi:MAG TPA: TIGR03435 family protein [Bryobacteraceae bacterium]|jgi:uncharacterized protein (TIGR03435 family)|nr:TIGR03435 family protein [Bryobacteraceae bacterium]